MGWQPALIAYFGGILIVGAGSALVAGWRRAGDDAVGPLLVLALLWPIALFFGLPLYLLGCAVEGLYLLGQWARKQLARPS